MARFVLAEYYSSVARELDLWYLVTCRPPISPPRLSIAVLVPPESNKHAAHAQQTYSKL